jgi:hypothetical protein
VQLLAAIVTWVTDFQYRRDLTADGIERRSGDSLLRMNRGLQTDDEGEGFTDGTGWLTEVLTGEDGLGMTVLIQLDRMHARLWTKKKLREVADQSGKSPFDRMRDFGFSHSQSRGDAAK